MSVLILGALVTAALAGPSLGRTWHIAARAVEYRPSPRYLYRGGWLTPPAPTRTWWAMRDGCPEQTSFREAWEYGYERWCEDSLGRRQGPSTRWSATGARLEDGSWYDGEPYGLWLYWHDSGALAETGYLAAGKRSFMWVSCKDGRLAGREGWMLGERLGLSVTFDPVGPVAWRVYDGDTIVDVDVSPKRITRRMDPCHIRAPAREPTERESREQEVDSEPATGDPTTVLEGRR